jgi:hypothetical protein
MQTLTRKQLASAYGIHPATLARLLKKVPGLLLQRHSKYLTPAQLAKIKEHAGPWD